MTRFEALVSLNLVPDIGTIRLKKLLEIFGSPEEIFRAGPERLSVINGIGAAIAAKICAFKEARSLDKELELAKKFGLKILTLEDAGYPQSLKYIFDPPIALYVKGKILPEDILSVGIVGSRKASFYGLKNAEIFARDLALRGFTVVSGMARGIDTCAHQGALKAGGRTIAVIGSGFGNLYPEENKRLAEEISLSGAVVSEFPVQTLPLRQNFPRRNRLISGLSLGVLVAEAAKNSGALITADFALEQGKDVFAIPGKVDSFTSSGANCLIQQGAKLVTCVDDILEEFCLHGAEKKQQNVRPSKQAQSPAVSKEDMIYNLISGNAVQIDELIEMADMDIPSVSEILLRLQMKKLIQQLPGNHFVRSSDES